MDTTSRKASVIPRLSTAAISALQHGRKIAAIKIVREERNIGLKEAKNVVDDYVRVSLPFNPLSPRRSPKQSGAQ